MKSNRRWFQIAGTLSLVALFSLSLVWVMVVGAAHDADDIGTVATDKPVVSPDEANVASGDRTVTVTVADEDLDETLFVGEGHNDEATSFDIDADGDKDANDEIIIRLDDNLGFGSTFDIDLSLGGGQQDVSGTRYTVMTGDPSTFLPLVDRDFDGSVDGDDIEIATSVTEGNDIGPESISILALFVSANGQMRIQNTPALLSGDRFALRWATSGREATVVSVQGDAGVMALSLLEGATSGEFLGSFVVTDEATIDIGDVRDEQHAVPGGLLANRAISNESHTVGSHLVENDAFAVDLDFAPVDTDGDAGADGGAVGVADILIGGAAAANLEISSAGDINVGGLQVALTGTANASIGDAYTLSYGRAINGELIVVPAGETFAITLAATVVDGNDDGAITTTDIVINAVTATTITIAANGDIDGAVVTFTVGVDDEEGQSFTVDYVGEVIQNETIPATGLQPGESQALTLDNPPLSDANASGGIDTGDITVNLPTIAVDVVTGDDGGITIRNSSASEILVGTQFAMSYRGADQFSITLAQIPLQGAAPIIADLVVPSFGNAAALYQINETDTATGLIRFGALADSPTTGTVLGVSYAGSEQHTPPGIAKAVGESFEILLENEVRDGPDAGTDIGPADVTVVSGNVQVMVVTGDQGTIRIQGTAPLGADETFSFSYVRPANFNPQNALTPGQNVALPIVSATSGTQTTITYEDAAPNVDIAASVSVEADAPIFHNGSPEDGFSTAAASAIDFSIEVTDVGDAGVDADAADTIASTIRFVLTTDRPPVAGFSDPTNPAVRDFVVTADSISAALGTFTATLALDSPNLTLPGLDIPAGFVTTISWWVEAIDKAGNASVTDADGDSTNGNQAFTLSIDAVASTMTDAYTGDWWDPAAGRIKGTRGAVTTGGSMTNSIRVDFSETIDGLSVNADGSEFTVAGFTVTGAQHFAGALNSVFLTVTPDLNPDSAPVVSLIGEITDLAGNPAATGDETSKDGIAPTPIATTSVDLSTGVVSITVTTNEDIRTRRPVLNLFTDVNNVDVDPGLTPTAITPSPDANEWVFDFNIVGAQTYSVVVKVEDAARNEGSGGAEDYTAAGAVTFQIDTALGRPETDPVDADGNNAADITVPRAPVIFLALDWSTVETGEYTGDSHSAVSLTSAVLDTGADGERDLLAELVASVRNGNEWSMGIGDVALGDHTLTYTASDDAGNTFDGTLTFTVTEPDPFVLDFTTGMNLMSLPGDPDNTSINAVFGDVPQVNLVFTREGDRWLVAERGADGAFSGNLTDIDSRHGYWVRATAAATLSVQIPPLAALSTLPEIPVVGDTWNLVPVISLLQIGPAGHQINQNAVTSADDYLGAAWTRAFTFDGRNWIRVEKGDDITFGSGYWVFFTADGTLVP
jgi:hypothetical protein